MTARFIVADVMDGLASLETGSVDLVVTSPPFLALRSYLPADHVDKGKEIGSESTPAEFIDTLLKVTAELRRVLAPHGSICVELGDTYAGSGGAGGDYNEDGLRDGQAGYQGSAQKHAVGRSATRTGEPGRSIPGRSLTPIPTVGSGWPLAKSRTLIPSLYQIALAYGFNPLTGQPSPAGQWRIRNVVTWARPNPPVGALGDKWRPATSDLIIACTSGKRYWDDLATRKPSQGQPDVASNGPKAEERERLGIDGTGRYAARIDSNGAGAPLLDYWVIPPGGYTGSHYAVFPEELVVPCVQAMCPERVCVSCGEPSRRIVKSENHSDERLALAAHMKAQREAKGISVKELAARFPSASGGVTGCVWNWENAANVPTSEQWPVLAELLDLSDEFHHLIEGERTWTESLAEYLPHGNATRQNSESYAQGQQGQYGGAQSMPRGRATKISRDAGWSDCGHNTWRPGLILDPFAGSGTTLAVATGHGHDAIGLDIDSRNADLARDRVGPFLFELEEL